MRSFFTFLIAAAINLFVFAQSNGNAFHPMTASGALSVSLQGHYLYWENPDSVYFNEVYFSTDSSLVANHDPSVLFLSGDPSTVYDSVQLAGTLNWNTKYYWSVLEWYLLGSKVTRGFEVPVWYFYSVPQVTYQDFTFDNDLEGWQSVGPQGMNNWFWSNTSHTSNTPGEMAFGGSPSFTGTSYLISPELPEPAGFNMIILFWYYLDHNADTSKVRLGITTDDGNTWETLWEINATSDVGPQTGYSQFDAPGNVRFGFYYTGNSDNINYFYADEVFPGGPLTIGAYPPAFLKVRADSTQKQVLLNWSPGSSIDPIDGYLVQRQDGLPEDNNPYVTIGQTAYPTQVFVDTSVSLDQNYTYRVATVSIGYHSYYSNEATAYVPPVVPVEMVSFTAAAAGNSVTLNWVTATEINNRGFEVERKSAKNAGESSIRDWENIGFVSGYGTTIEPHTYSFTDNVTEPASQSQEGSSILYRLKQIDLDGSYQYSNIAEVSLGVPEKFALAQNYPNPFNPATSISFSLPEAGFVSLKVFDVLGNEVETLVNENKSPGTYKISFNAGGLTSGIYFYELAAGSYYSVRKMILLK